MYVLWNIFNYLLSIIYFGIIYSEAFANMQLLFVGSCTRIKYSSVPSAGFILVRETLQSLHFPFKIKQSFSFTCTLLRMRVK